MNQRSVATGIVAAAHAYIEALDQSPFPNPVGALLSVKQRAGQEFDPRVVAALESVVWARLRLAPGDMAPGPRPESAPEPVQPVRTPPAAASAALATLTEREQEILNLVAKGLSNRDIASQLFVTEATVKTHVSRILQKLGVSDRTKAAVCAHEAYIQRQKISTM